MLENIAHGVSQAIEARAGEETRQGPLIEAGPHAEADEARDARARPEAHDALAGAEGKVIPARRSPELDAALAKVVSATTDFTEAGKLRRYIEWRMGKVTVEKTILWFVAYAPRFVQGVMDTTIAFDRLATAAGLFADIQPPVAELRR